MLMFKCRNHLRTRPFSFLFINKQGSNQQNDNATLDMDSSSGGESAFSTPTHKPLMPGGWLDGMFGCLQPVWTIIGKRVDPWSVLFLLHSFFGNHRDQQIRVL
jgi:hypothetical protein